MHFFVVDFPERSGFSDMIKLIRLMVADKLMFEISRRVHEMDVHSRRNST